MGGGSGTVLVALLRKGYFGTCAPPFAPPMRSSKEYYIYSPAKENSRHQLCFVFERVKLRTAVRRACESAVEIG
jgi:hypothetical protein